MEIKVVIKKTHLFILVALVVLVGFVIAQSSPNPGHTVSQIFGATPNCQSNPGSSNCAGPASASWGLNDVAIAAGVSWNSAQLGGLAADSYCRSDGTNCPVPNNPVIGSVVGGGNSGAYDVNGGTCIATCSSWGVATCSGTISPPTCGGNLQCPAGSTQRITTGLASLGSPSAYHYICVKN